MIQEILALTLVAIVVAGAIWRKVKPRPTAGLACSACTVGDCKLKAQPSAPAGHQS